MGFILLNDVLHDILPPFNPPRCFLVLSHLGGGFLIGEEGEVMPSKPLKPCKYPGCPKLTSGSYCEEHAKKVASDYNHYTRSANHNKKYGRQWKRIRDRYAKAHPLCERCLKEGRLTPMEEVHHILPVNRGGSNDDSNLMSLCHSCHQWIHHNVLHDR